MAEPPYIHAGSDGLCVPDDNCPGVSNVDQLVANQDGIGDECDDLLNSDGNGAADGNDNCLQALSRNQLNTDVLEQRDASDNDNEGAADVDDAGPLSPLIQLPLALLQTLPAVLGQHQPSV